MQLRPRRIDRRSRRAEGTGTGGGGGRRVPRESACGGDAVGTWTVASSCLTVTVALDVGLAGGACPSAPVMGSLTVTGTFTVNADGTYSDNTTTTGDEHFTLAPSCLVITSTPVTCDGAASIIKTLGYSSLTCTPTAGGGGHRPLGHGPSDGWARVPFGRAVDEQQLRDRGQRGHEPERRGERAVLVLRIGRRMTLTPQSASPTMTGTIVLQQGGSAGTGGGSAGTTGRAARRRRRHRRRGRRGGQGAGAGGAAGDGGRGGAAGAAGSAGGGGRGGAAARRAAGRGGAGGTAGGAGRGRRGRNRRFGQHRRAVRHLQERRQSLRRAHSTVRALFGAYSGKLYQVRNAAGVTKDILTLTPGGAADGLSQDAFCSGTTCVTTVLYDQSGHGNDLWYQGSTMVPASTSSRPATATTESLTLNGHKVYSLYINANNSYWVDASKSGIALGSQPEGLYMVTSGKHFNSGCCFDYGNSEVGRTADGPGTMDAINLSSITAWGTGAGNGPWVLADLEYGLFSQTQGGSKNQNVPTQTSTYVTAVLKNNGTTEFALRGGNAQSGNLSTYFKGALPGGGWSPMKKQGAIVLGSGGDCCKLGGAPTCAPAPSTKDPSSRATRRTQRKKQSRRTSGRLRRRVSNPSLAPGAGGSGNPLGQGGSGGGGSGATVCDAPTDGVRGALRGSPGCHAANSAERGRSRPGLGRRGRVASSARGRRPTSRPARACASAGKPYLVAGSNPAAGLLMDKMDSRQGDVRERDVRSSAS